MAGNIHRGNENEPIALEFYFWLVVIGYYESPISTTTNSVTNLCWKTSLYDADYLKNDVFKLEKETFLNITSDQRESNEIRNFIPEFTENLMIKNNRYEVKLLKKVNLIELLPGCYLFTTHPLKLLCTRLCKDKGLVTQ